MIVRDDVLIFQHEVVGFSWNESLLYLISFPIGSCQFPTLGFVVERVSKCWYLNFVNRSREHTVQTFHSQKA